MLGCQGRGARSGTRSGLKSEPKPGQGNRCKDRRELRQDAGKAVRGQEVGRQDAGGQEGGRRSRG